MSQKKLLTRNELARRAGCSPAAVSKAKKQGRAYADSTGLYDPGHPANLNFINTGSGQRKNASTEAVNTNLPPEQVPDELKDLYERKLKAEVRRAEAQANKLELEFAERKGSIIPKSSIQLYLGHFVFGINNFFFNVAPRVARDDKILRERIQKEISIAIKKTKQHAAEESRKGVVAVYKEDMKHGLN